MKERDLPTFLVDFTDFIPFIKGSPLEEISSVDSSFETIVV